MKIIIKPFSEIMVKSKAVRKKYLKILQQNLFIWLKKIDEKININLFWDKLEVDLVESSVEIIDKIKKALSRIPWIEVFLEVEWFIIPPIIGNPFEKWGNQIFEFILEKTSEFYLEKIEKNSFVVRVKRNWNHEFKSLEVERFIWWELLKRLKEKWINGKVELNNPEVTVKIEIKDNNLFIVKSTIFGIWGFPTWTQDKVLSLISGGFDSWVSTYSMIKRWCKVDFLFFNLWGRAHELWVKQVAYYLNSQFSSWYIANIITVPFEEVIKELIINVVPRFRGIILKRCMLKIADKIANENEYYAIIKWDSLWQVSSQTLKNIFVIDKACETLVLRPLISFNKQEIINISKKIWTYDFAINMPEYCAVISDKPSTWAKLSHVLGEEEKFNEKVLEEAFLNRKTILTSEIFNEINDIEEDVNIVNFPNNLDIIIDVREEVLVIENPLKIELNKIINIPFFDINFEFEKLDQNKNYLLYCDKWILSKLHALYLKEKGFKNVWVLRIIEKDKECGIL